MCFNPCGGSDNGAPESVDEGKTVVLITAMKDPNATPEDVLTPFGFTELESRLYGELVKRSPATGYGLGKAVGKATANAYQALNGLVRKGAVIADDGDPRTYRAVPPAELFAALRGDFAGKADSAEAALASLYSPPDEQRLYPLKNLAQAIERARGVIRAANEILLFDLFPLPLQWLRAELDDAFARGVVVAGLVYGPTDARFSHVIGPGEGFTTQGWPGLQMTLINDGREVLVALVAADGRDLVQGYWSDSAFVACLHHNGLASELRLAALSPNGGDPLQALSLLSSMPSGLRTLNPKPHGDM